MKAFEDWDRIEVISLVGMFVTPTLGALINYQIQGESLGVIAFLGAPSGLPVWVVVVGATVLLPPAALWGLSLYRAAQKPSTKTMRGEGPNLHAEFEAVVEEERVVDGSITLFCPECETCEMEVRPNRDPLRRADTVVRCPCCKTEEFYEEGPAELYNSVRLMCERAVRDENRGTDRNR
jgi:hypothetical protein